SVPGVPLTGSFKLSRRTADLDSPSPLLSQFPPGVPSSSLPIEMVSKKVAITGVVVILAVIGVIVGVLVARKSSDSASESSGTNSSGSGSTSTTSGSGTSTTSSSSNSGTTYKLKNSTSSASSSVTSDPTDGELFDILMRRYRNWR
ncbi:hypothetical protein F441_09318, partial [Phytophthora nicotianae CJ01A1]